MIGTLLEKLFVSIQADLSGLTEETNRAAQEVQSATRSISSHFESIGGSLQTLGKRTAAVGAVATAGITVPLIAAAKDMVAAWGESEQALAQVEAALKSTAGAAGKSMEELEAQAKQLQSTSLFGDDEILKDVTANLLTFTKVHGKVFDQAQQAILDYSARLNVDLKSATIQIGKALNDPVKAIGALSRAGVQFSEDQKAMIESLVETGDVAGAQAIILKELETQFGGAAAAAANAGTGPLQQLNMALGDLKEVMGGLIVEMLPGIVDGVKELTKWVAALGPEQLKWLVILGAIAAAAGPVLTAIGGLIFTFGGLVKLAPAILAAGRMIGVAISAAGGPITMIIAAIGLLVGAYIMYKDEVDAAVKAAYEAVDEFLGGKLTDIVNAAKAIFSGWVDHIKLMFQLFYQLVTGDFSGALDTLKSIWENVWQTMSDVMNALFGVTLDDIVASVTGFVSSVVETIISLKDQVVETLTELIGAAEEWLVTNFTGVIEAAKALFQGWIDHVTLVFQLFTDLVTGDFSGALETLKELWNNAWQTLSDVLKNLFGVSLDEMMAKFASFGESVVQSLVDLKDRAIQAAMDMVNGIRQWFVDKFNEIVDSITGKITAVGDSFAWLYDQVVGNSWVPDMIEETGDWFAMLDEKMVKPTEEATKKVSDEFEILSNTLSDHLRTFFETGQFDFGAFIQDLNSQLLDKAIKTFSDSLSDLLQNFMSSIFSSIGSSLGGSGGSGGIFSAIGNIFSSIFGGGRAVGGVVPPWKSFVAGERGAELIERDGPSGASRISTAGRTKRLLGAGGGGNTTVVFNMPQGTNMEEFRRSESQISSMIARSVDRGRRNQ